MTDVAVHPYASHAPVFSVDSRTEGAIARDLLRLDVEEGLLGLRTLVARLHAIGPTSDGSDEDLSYLDGEVVDIGRRIEVSLGPPGGERMVFKGTISAIEVAFAEGAPPHVAVFAEDSLMRLRMTERTATYIDMTDADILREVAGRHGLGDAGDVDGPTHPVVQQWEASDLAFLRDRARRLNAELWVDGDDVVHLADRTQRRGVDIELVQGNQLIAANARVDLAHQRTEVEVRGWDDVAVAAVSEKAGADLVRAEVSSGRVGPEVLAEVFPDASLVRSRRDVRTGPVAGRYARAEMSRRARGFVTVDGVTAGTPDLVPGAHLTLRRMGRPFEGDGYRVCHMHHSYDLVRGHRTRFRAERPVVER